MLWQGSGSDSWKNIWYAKYGKIILFSTFAGTFGDVKNAFKTFLESENLLPDSSWASNFRYINSNTLKSGYLCGGSNWSEFWIYKNNEGQTIDAYLVYRFDKSDNTVTVQDYISGSGLSSSDKLTIPIFSLFAK